MKKGLLVLMAAAALFPHCQADIFNDINGKDAKALAAFVTGAAALIEEKGEQAFAAFEDPKGDWKKGRLNITVLSQHGVIVSPAKQSALELTTTEVGRLIEQAAQTPPVPWFFSKNAKMAAGKDKLANINVFYAKQVKLKNGSSFTVTASLYGLKPEKAFAIAIVKNAASLINQNGTEEAFDIMRKEENLYTYGDIYVFVIKPDGLEIFNRAFPSNENKNLYDLQDTDGRFMVRQMIETAKEKNEGWVYYTWPKPAEQQPSQKAVFAQKTRLSEKDWVITAAGLYTDALAEK